MYSPPPSESKVGLRILTPIFSTSLEMFSLLFFFFMFSYSSSFCPGPSTDKDDADHLHLLPGLLPPPHAGQRGRRRRGLPGRPHHCQCSCLDVRHHQPFHLRFQEQAVSAGFILILVFLFTILSLIFENIYSNLRDILVV